MFDSAQQFYPTPKNIGDRMWEKIKGSKSRRSDPNNFIRILDPQAGSGALLEAIPHRGQWDNCDRYAIEIDPDLRAILNDKDFTVIGSDFLEYSEPVTFDMVIMNPPFNRDAEHILKAWNLVRDGGVLCALCNSQTIVNPDKKWSRLNELIEQYGEREDLGQCFKDADRKTNVEVSMILLEKPKRPIDPEKFQFSGNFQSAPWSEKADEFAANPLAHLDVIDNLIVQYQRCLSILKTRSLVQDELTYHVNSIPYIQFDHNEHAYLCETKGTFEDQVWQLKKRFWGGLFKLSKMSEIETSYFQRLYTDFVKTQQKMEFCKANIMDILAAFFTNREQIMLDSLGKAFDQATAFHPDNKIHFEGWKNNSGWKINKRIIVPYGMPWRADRGWWENPSTYQKDGGFFLDLDVICCWIMGQDYKDPNYTTMLKLMGRRSTIDQIQTATWYDLKFFRLKFFKKGTVWIEITDKYLLDDFNLLAAQQKKWIGDG